MGVWDICFGCCCHLLSAHDVRCREREIYHLPDDDMGTLFCGAMDVGEAEL